MRGSRVDYRLRRTLVWVRRWRKTRGFGVQSPTDYHFVRRVINDHRHHADYDTLADICPDIDRKTRKVCRLYYRIARWLQPDEAQLCQMPSTVYRQYIAQGSPKTRITEEDSASSLSGNSLSLSGICNPRPPIFLACDLNDDTTPYIIRVLEQAADGTVVIINGIHRSRHHKSLWQKVRNAPHATLTFDVYYCGIVIKNTRRAKQHYVINY